MKDTAVNKLTICAISHGDRSVIESFWKSFRSLADEFVIINTGSEIWDLQKNGLLTDKFDWRDDFSLARNYALEKVKGEGWVMMLDIDNRMDLEEQVALKAFLEKAEEEVVMLFNKFHQRVWRDPKVWRNSLGIRYEYPVHERAIQPKRCKIGQFNAVINLGEAENVHYVRSRQKYVEIMKRFLKMYPDDQRMMYYLVADLYFLKDFEGLIPIAKRLLSFEDLRSDEASKVIFWLSKAHAHV